MIRPLDIGRFPELHDVRVALDLLAIGQRRRADPLPGLAAPTRTWRVPEHNHINDGTEVTRLDKAFHLSIVAAAGNAEALRERGSVVYEEFELALRVLALVADHDRMRAPRRRGAQPRYTTFLARSAATCCASTPISRRISSVCPPQSGVALRISCGVRDSRTGWLTSSI